jgi:hypothetical protein
VIRISSIFRRVSADQVREDQLYEAERCRVEHLAAAEWHAGLAGVYGARIDRLRRELGGESSTPLRAVK